jgi:nucleoside triphosphate diphosphatase
MTNPIQELRALAARLRAPGGCPWDREQTHESLRRDLIEEAYEVVDAIDRKDDAHLREELGDFLLQVVMHCEIASERGSFDLDEVAREVAEKLVRRHPHVFGEKKLGDSEAVLKQWDDIKRQEKGAASVLDNIAHALPALMRAEKVQKRAGRVGFDWPDARGVVEKIHEELGELEAAQQSGRQELVVDEIGDLLFSAVNLARKAKVDPELALNQATNKFIDRFKKLEAVLAQRGQKFEQLTLAEMDAIWDEVKMTKAE